MRLEKVVLSAALLGAIGGLGPLEVAAQVSQASQASQASQDRPEGYEQILPRGRIAAVNDPVYVSAEQAKIRDDSWVLGVVLDGKAFAYSLNLLNSHEVVNDSVGDVDFAAVW